MGPPSKKRRRDDGEAEEVKMLPQIPLSEQHIKPEEKEEKEFEEGQYKVKNILAEDPMKKKWLVEWEGDDFATWESFDTLRNSKVFQEHIEKQMSQSKPSE
jgi:hypothetical protein